nr:MAG TPA: hypothetical protein [Caudoviricetes sp.]
MCIKSIEYTLNFVYNIISSREQTTVGRAESPQYFKPYTCENRNRAYQ